MEKLGERGRNGKNGLLKNSTGRTILTASCVKNVEFGYR